MNHLCNYKNSKSFYNHINQKLSRTPLSVFLTDANSNKICENTAVELVGSYFYSTYSYDNGKLLTSKKHYNNFYDNVAFDSSKIIKYSKKPPNKYSSRPDGIPSALSNKLSKELSLPSSILF